MALILIGCEESQRVCMAFRALGHDAYSCDLKTCSGGFPEYHLQMDVFEAIKLRSWDAAIFFPDCTYLAVSGLHWNTRNIERALKTDKALQFVGDLINCGIPKIAIENPVGAISSRIRKPDQIIQPFQFGDNASKQTCLWLYGFPLLIPTSYVSPRFIGGKPRWDNQGDDGQNKIVVNGKWLSFRNPLTKIIRSKTYPGIAQAMAQQWGKTL